MRRIVVCRGALLVVSLLLGAGCGTVAKINAVRQTADNLAHGTTGDKKLDALIARFNDGTKAVFVAEYKVTTTTTGSNGSSSSQTKPGEYRVAQKPPKSRLEFGDTGSSDREIIIDDGADNFVCSPGASQCLKSPGSGSGAGAAFAAGAFGFLNPTVFIGALKSFAPLAGVKVATNDFSKGVAGQTTDCVTATVSGGGQKTHASTYCSTKEGILAYSDDGAGTVVELTKYDTNVSDSEFTPPKPVTTDPTQAFTGTTVPDSSTTTAPDTSGTTSPDTSTTLPGDSSSTTAPGDSSTSTTSTTTGG